MNTDNKWILSGHAYPTGTIQLTGDSFQFTLDVSEFPPEDVIISYYNNRLDVHAEKVSYTCSMI